MKLENKVAIITGASRGIGYAIAEAFVVEGAKIAVCGSRLETAEKARASILAKYPKAQVLALGVNMCDTAEIKKMVADTVKEFGGIDILVNNAGITDAKSILDTTDEDFERMMEINLVAPFKCTREVTPIMKEKGKGSIINTSSMVSLFGGRMQVSYATSKFGVNGLTRCCARELGAYGIRVNAVAPGVVATDMVAATVSDQMMAGIKSITALGRPASPEELAGIYVHLASDDASFTTGAIISVDGGIVM